MSAEELTEGKPIVPQSRQLWRDATRWKIIDMSEEEDPCVTFQAGTYPSEDGLEIPVVFRCHKSGMIYREWEKERMRREAGGSAPPEPDLVQAIPVEAIFQRGPEPKTEVPPVVRLVDSQLEERQHRLNEMRRKFHLLNWGDEKDRLLSEIVALEKKVLGDP
jgi:hypothetical protein